MTQVQNQFSGGEEVENAANIHAPAEAERARRLPSLWRNRDFMLL